MNTTNEERTETEFCRIARTVSAPFIEEMEQAASKWLDWNLEQFTIDLLQEWDEDIDINPSEHAGALCYQYDNILAIMEPELDDYECVSELLRICRRWNKAIKSAWLKYRES